MSDYMYLLDSHVSREQNRLLTEVQAAAVEANVALYLTGGAMRDMLGGFPIRDLDFTFEALPAKLTKPLAKLLPDAELEEDPLRKIVEVKLPCGVTGSLRMAHVAKVAKAGGTPRVTPAAILEDLARRDFTVDAIAISLAKAARGLIRDPMNGQSDLQNRELRVCYSQAFFDDPARLLRAIRFKHRLSFQIEERTQRYFSTAVEERWIDTLEPRQWHNELRLICEEDEASAILQELSDVGLLPVEAETLNLASIARFEKLRRQIPGRGRAWPLFLQILTEHMKAPALAALGLEAEDLNLAKGLKARIKKLAQVMQSPQLRRPSQVYNALSGAHSDEVLGLLYESDQRLVQDRLRNYLQKYLPMASEVTDAQVEASGAKLGTPQFAKAKTALIAALLNAPPPPPPPEIPEGTVPVVEPQNRMGGR